MPVEVIKVDGLPKVMSGNCPVTPVNVALKRRREIHGATDASLDVYVRGGRLLVEFAAHRRRALIDLTNEEFRWFVHALQDRPFPDAEGRQAFLSGRRCGGTADLMIAVLYSLAQDIQEIYDVRFDWYRYRRAPLELVELVRALGGQARVKSFRRAHRVPHTPTKVLALPDEEFERLLRAAYEMWGETVADGDMAFAEDPEAQRGALFHRNLVILLIMRLEGARRGEVPFITIEDVDRANRRLYLVTKGHGGARGEKLPVLLHPLVESALWVYVAKYRPTPAGTWPKGSPVLVSHGTMNYGGRISPQCVRKVVDSLRDALTPPWDELVSPHTLRHSFARDLQEHAGDVATIINMRHASTQSLIPYSASPEVFADQLLASGETRLAGLLSKFGVEPEGVGKV
ncbi:MAG: site-specific integrase [Acidobacteria bacterium]|nr:site-specific integrase [Acidobacteriota bacterium]